MAATPGFLVPASEGFALGLSLIVAIGAQNAFVLKQGLRRDRVALVVATCAVIDATLIALGVVGLGALIEAAPWAVTAASAGGAAFLIWYGTRSLIAAFHPGALVADEGGRATGAAWPVFSATLAVSLLNPHVYLDTVVLLGGIAARYEPGLRTAFALGAMTASVTWFSSLGFGARLLSPVFARPAAWRVLDLLVAAVMYSVAMSLVVGLLG